MKIRKIKGKRGDAEDVIYPNIFFLLLNLVVFLSLFYFVWRAGHTDSFLEQQYAKKTALLIDSAEEGTEINMNIEKLMKTAEKNKYGGDIISIDEKKRVVRVNVAKGEGYGFSYFSGLKVKGLEDRKNKNFKLTIENE